MRVNSFLRKHFILFYYVLIPSRFGSVVGHPNLDGQVSGSSLGHNKDLKNGTYSSSACAGHNEHEYIKGAAHTLYITMDIQTKVV